MTNADHIPISRAVGTVRLASEFLVAANRNGFDQSPPSFVTYFLIGHALELALKAVLIAQGTTEKTLRTIGHDLEKAADAAKEAAPDGTIDLNAGDLERIGCLSPIYRGKALEYLEPGFARLPIPRDLYDVTARLVEGITKFVEERVRLSLDDAGAG